MTQLFISHSHNDAACAEQLRSDLATAGYIAWKDTHDIAPGSSSYVRAIENGIRASAATLVIWSQSAAASEWVERELLFSQQLQKPIFPIYIDDTEPGILLVAAQHVKSQLPCNDAVSKLLPHLPPVDDDELQLVSALLAHEHIRERKIGIRRAAALIQEGRFREQLLASLEDIARKDLMMGVREEAAKVLAQVAGPAVAGTLSRESRHSLRVRCPKGHIVYFDRRQVCSDQAIVKRSVTRAGTQLQEMLLTCPQDGEQLVVPVECEGYR